MATQNSAPLGLLCNQGSNRRPTRKTLSLHVSDIGQERRVVHQKLMSCGVPIWAMLPWSITATRLPRAMASA